MYRAGLVWLADSWHMAKHFMLLSWAGAVACVLAYAIALEFGLAWYYQAGIQVGIWWSLYWLEGNRFNHWYQKLKQ
ncbi:MAG: hypothetical protein IMZ53_12885 [Thermoplasmata archaeon]|nr:hypothetical protein [Thermoplasmata archaeon]